ncbi:hypothetical protein DCO58_12220 [Helicobacter saguini]|uniref:DUF3944 domain-containing protein n=1 Tax=Helicobacter saguini TaxID=1548018 RepID=A0A347VZ50_9HELI|nr:hypothetical protein [Helicobacter saguini]MWV60945.1 hypothetical protein [Helicobacter saguini]MWV68387.1 hypothetical protein [Helicobacter saguini]MWV70149.1 hypothetical protein [Helicobacter saguini]MWV72052.1 hypothetical protein [Helicobacter saguini]TLD93724.1 hypothetical protein LS64_007995 [Helicobacter saguini]
MDNDLAFLDTPLRYTYERIAAVLGINDDNFLSIANVDSHTLAALEANNFVIDESDADKLLTKAMQTRILQLSNGKSYKDFLQDICKELDMQNSGDCESLEMKIIFYVFDKALDSMNFEKLDNITKYMGIKTRNVSADGIREAMENIEPDLLKLYVSFLVGFAVADKFGFVKSSVNGMKIGLIDSIKSIKEPMQNSAFANIALDNRNINDLYSNYYRNQQKIESSLIDSMRGAINDLEREFSHEFNGIAAAIIIGCARQEFLYERMK